MKEITIQLTKTSKKGTDEHKGHFYKLKPDGICPSAVKLHQPDILNTGVGIPHDMNIKLNIFI